MPTLTVVRHGKTELNASGRLRGWIDVPLSQEGIDEAKKTALELPQLPVFSSDLQRARQTAECFSDRAPTYIPALRPWNVGLYAGQPASVVHPRLVALYDTPYVKTPFGESFDEFVKRYTKFLWSIVCDCVVVTHYRNCKVLQALEVGRFKRVDMSTLLRDDVETGSVFRVRIPG